MSGERVWVTSDTHFGHESIIKYCNRPFKTIQEMDEYIIEKWNSMIQKQDHVYIIGDFAFNNHMKYIDALKGRKHLILGNHDSMSAECYKRFVTVSEQKQIKYQNHYFVLSHCPLRNWTNSYRGTTCLFGHVHGRIKTYNLSFDIGMDTHNYIPYNMDEIIKMVNDREKEMKKNHRIVEESGKKTYYQDDVKYLEFIIEKLRQERCKGK